MKKIGADLGQSQDRPGQDFPDMPRLQVEVGGQIFHFDLPTLLKSPVKVVKK